MKLMSGFRRPPRHLPPEPNVVRLIPPPTDPELPEPEIGPPIGRDHETLALSAALDMGPLAAYWAATTGLAPAYAPAWAAWVKKRRHERGLEGWLRYQDNEECE